MAKIRHPLFERLEKRGWTPDEISHVQKAFFSEEAKQGVQAVQLNRLMYWMIFLVMLIGNLILSIAFIPLYITITEWALLLVLGVVGISFGSVFNLMIKDLKHIDPRHYTAGLILLPAIAVADIFLVLFFVNKFAVNGSVFLQQNPVHLSVVYVIAFMLPLILRMSISKLHQPTH